MDVEITRLRDGGTDVMTISERGISKVFYIDNRIRSTTKGRVYDDYPNKGKIVSKNLESKLLKIYNSNKK